MVSESAEAGVRSQASVDVSGEFRVEETVVIDGSVHARASACSSTSEQSSWCRTAGVRTDRWSFGTSKVRTLQGSPRLSDVALTLPRLAALKIETTKR